MHGPRARPALIPNNSPLPVPTSRVAVSSCSRVLPRHGPQKVEPLSAQHQLSTLPISNRFCISISCTLPHGTPPPPAAHRHSRDYHRISHQCIITCPVCHNASSQLSLPTPLSRVRGFHTALAAGPASLGCLALLVQGAALVCSKFSIQKTREHDPPPGAGTSHRSFSPRSLSFLPSPTVQRTDISRWRVMCLRSWDLRLLWPHIFPVDLFGSSPGCKQAIEQSCRLVGAYHRHSRVHGRTGRMGRML